MKPGELAAGIPLTAFDLDQPVLGPEPIRATTYLHAAELGVDLSGVPDHLTLRQAVSLLRGWTTPAEQAEAVALNQDLWMMIGGRDQLRPPPETPPLRMTISSAVHAGALREGLNDFSAYIYAIVAAAYRRASLTGSVPACSGTERRP